MLRVPRRSTASPSVRALLAAAALAAGAAPGLAQGPAGSGPPPAEALLEEARQRELDRLERSVGRYARGEAAVYAGTLEVTDRAFGRPGKRLPRGPVVASLEERASLPWGGTGIVLTVVGAQHGLWLRLGQSGDDPGVTRVTRLRPLHGSPGIAASCGGCLDDLGTRPGTIRFDRFEAVGRLGDLGGTEVRVEISGRLDLVPPAELELAEVEPVAPDLEAFLDGESEGFTRRGGEGVRRVEGELRSRVPPPRRSPPETECERVTRYAAERFVDLADLGRFGVRDVELLGTEICCMDNSAHGDAERCSPEAAP